MKALHRNKTMLALFTLAFALLFQASVVSAASTDNLKVSSQEVQLVFDGKILIIPEGQYVFNIKGTNYVPLRFFSYALLKKVSWDGKTSTVSVTEPTKQQAMVLKEYLVNALGQEGQFSSKSGTKNIVSPVEATFSFDGKVKSLPVGQSAYSLGGSIYVPVRFMSESVNMDIKWAAGGKILAESAAYKLEQAGENETVDPAEGTPEPTGPTAKPTYESITASAKASLDSLEQSYKSQLMPLGLQLIDETDPDTINQLTIQINGIISQCTEQFNTIISQTENLLTANGYNTSVISEYRQKFQDEMDGGRELLDQLT
ncbi:copper amine oxidase N-terminal domain-containing protein [Cohnella lupini]|uniref:Copper amine oxidase-like protein n=1 Tax=Cohnella lupini TaxID=1294267 RepID=A0A3D9IVV0_9BACL|nr:copper amine oxidase N-terminal domain-containing protein [Cohnella lupini]RED65825.1 copper amine oxidase-like protein [Cohnella lupini]